MCYADKNVIFSPSVKHMWVMHDWRDHPIGIIAGVIGMSLANWLLKEKMPNRSPTVQARCNHTKTMCMGEFHF